MAKNNELVRFENCKILRNGAIETDDYLYVRNGKIQDQMKLYFDEKIEPDKRIDCKGALLSAGLLDVQVNGGFGIDFSFNESNVEEGLNMVANGILQFGVTGFCPTLVSSHPDTYRKVLPRMGETTGAINLGIHLEGPFINADKVGAHAKGHLRNLSRGMNSVLETYGNLDNVKIMTIAPEVDGALETIKSLTQSGIVVSIGHSTANLSTAEEAVKNGATLITHLFNAMPPFHHRDPGILGLLTSENICNKPIYFGLINDGCHTDPAAVRIAYRVNYDGLVLVTDAISAAGLEEGNHRIGDLEINIRDNCAYIMGTNTLCGSILPLNKCVNLFDQFNQCGKVKAIEAATLHPARVLGISDRKGTLNAGADADITFFDQQNLDVLSTWIAGSCVYSKRDDVYEIIVD
ncbi:N-acetylglucosamine-6-phosphate deacetylase [Planococcus citri]|uniref:N-acetylglucosamine-6-phosphate deacetylase n=1 Tax=Planococcus citri TaxID=170843 RepID=UPI0031F9BA89